MIKYFRAYFRLLIFGASISIGMGYIMLVSLLRGKDLDRSMRIRRAWIKFISPVLGLKILNRTNPVPGDFLYIGNHRSFMDPVVILHHIFALPLAKSEVKSYPLIGFGAGITGVLYVVRDSADSRLDARQAIASTLQNGQSVLVYPEGTTFNTPLSGPFKKGSFEIAAVLDVPIIPVAIEYQDVLDHWKEKSLFQQYLYQFGKRECRCRIEYGDPIFYDDPEKLLAETQRWINNQLVSFRKEFDEGMASR
ncbi:MAG: 1-acyl-sn-glycerol-3-phosphate acyltransferase [Saprospiraceae bacterium]|nr:1-acyl-sn-glycerol-3-phosphate acyltransferase [Saprospiraceae bacterium]